MLCHCQANTDTVKVKISKLQNIADIITDWFGVKLMFVLLLGNDTLIAV